MRKVLVIDDEQPTLKMFRLFLDAYGYDVLTAENGEDGLSAFSEARPEMVLTDIKMPGMDGIEVLRKVKELDPGAEVIVITGHGDMELAIQALNLSATDFINKPVKKDALESALRRAEVRLSAAPGPRNETALDLSGPAPVLHIRGNVNSLSEGYLLETARREDISGLNRLILRFDENATINGAGISVLTRMIETLSFGGTRLAVYGFSATFREVFEAVGLSKLATAAANEREALRALEQE